MARRNLIPILFLVFVLLAGCREEAARPALHSIGMTGVADTLVVPDLAVWTIKISDLDAKLMVAKDASDGKLAAVLEALQKVDLIEGSVLTGPASIQRQFRRCDDGVNRFSHFSVQREVTFRQDNPDAVDEALDILVSAADIEASCYFELADSESIMKGLRTQAMDLARDKASSLAAYAGLELGEIRGLHVNEDDNPRRRHHRSMEGQVDGPQAQYLHTRVNVQFQTQ